MKNILFIGMGRMGFPMAGHIEGNEQFSARVHNRSPEKVQRWVETYNGQAHSPEFDVTYDVIVLCVGNDDDVAQNLVGEGSFTKFLKSGGVIIDHTTTSAALAQQMSAQLTDFQYLDAPVSGGEAGAMNGKLSCMVGGDKAAFEQVSELLKCYCHNIVHIGESGAGQIAKMANQLCIAGTLAGLSEAINLVEKAGINADNVYNAIKGGAAQSWQMDNRFPTMVAGEFDFGFAIQHMIKDLNYALEHCNECGVTAPVSEQVIERYQDLLKRGHASDDTSVLVEHYRKSR